MKALENKPTVVCENTVGLKPAQFAGGAICRCSRTSRGICPIKVDFQPGPLNLTKL